MQAYYVRKVDELGRFVIPKEVRRSLNILEGDELKIVPDENGIVLVKSDNNLNIKEEVQRLLRTLRENFYVCNRSDEHKRDALIEQAKQMINILDDVPVIEEPLEID